MTGFFFPMGHENVIFFFCSIDICLSDFSSLRQNLIPFPLFPEAPRTTDFLRTSHFRTGVVLTTVAILTITPWGSLSSHASPGDIRRSGPFQLVLAASRFSNLASSIRRCSAVMSTRLRSFLPLHLYFPSAELHVFEIASPDFPFPIFFSTPQAQLPPPIPLVLVSFLGPFNRPH